MNVAAMPIVGGVTGWLASAGLFTKPMSGMRNKK